MTAVFTIFRSKLPSNLSLPAAPRHTQDFGHSEFLRNKSNSGDIPASNPARPAQKNYESEICGGLKTTKKERSIQNPSHYFHNISS